MKRYLAILIAVVLCLSTAYADTYDMSIFRENSNIYTIDVDAENDVAFVESTLAVANRSFTHKYESDVRYSSTKFDLLILNYFETTAYPVFRMWITYAADEFLYITSATITLDGKNYTFSGISDSDWRHTLEDGIVEEVLIRFGQDNIDFILALANAYTEYNDENGTGEVSIPMVLHGKEDVETTLGVGFLLDASSIMMGWLASGGVDYIDKTNSTTMKVTDA